MGCLADPHRPVALHVRVSPHGAHAGTRAADVAAQQEEVDHLANRRHRVGVLGEAHRPADDDPLGSAGRASANRSATSRGRNRSPRVKCSQSNVRASSAKRSKPLVYCVDEVDVEGVVAASVTSRWLTALKNARSPLIRIGRWSSASCVPRPNSPLSRCGFLNRMQTGFGQRVDGDDRRRPLAWPSSSVDSIRGWLVPGFWPDHDDQVGVDEIGDVDRALADADRLGQRHPARLVTHVRTVGQVVRAEATGRATGTGTRPRCSSDPTCRTPRRPARAAPRSSAAINSNAVDQEIGS